MTKTELIKIVAENCDVTQATARTIIDDTFDTIEHAVTCGDTVRIIGHGTWKPAHRAARQSRNPSTGQLVDVPAKTVPVFTAAGPFKDKVAGKTA